MADDTDKKQLFLREEILDKKYDGCEFLLFLANKRPKGANVETWKYDELVMVVSEFQINNDPKKS